MRAQLVPDQTRSYAITGAPHLQLSGATHEHLVAHPNALASTPRTAGRPSFAGRARGMTPLGTVVKALVAGATGTAAMDALLYARYCRGHGEKGFELWES